jgi:AraC-like DNA-binding protein
MDSLNPLVTQPMRVEASAETRLWQMFFSADQLGLSVDAIRGATTIIGHSPLQRLVASHVLNMPTQDLNLLPSEALHAVGQATIELVRAMLIAAARPEAHSGSEVSATHLRHAIKQYVRLNLRDPQLSPQDIARAHHVSVRYLYNLWRDEETTLARWIGRQRLEAARQDLADPRLARKTIAAIGRDWGFPSAARPRRPIPLSCSCL